MTLNGGTCILNYSHAVLTNCPKDFDLLLFNMGRGKEKQSELVLKFRKIDNRVNKTVTTLQQLEIILPVLPL